MKKLIFIILCLLMVSGCSKSPRLEEGSCYSIIIYDTSSVDQAHELSTFKIVKIFDFQKQKHYAIQVINPNTDKPLYPKTTSYGYVRVKEFDTYMSPIVGKFSFVDTKGNKIKCNPVTNNDYKIAKKEDKLPFYKVGND